MSDPRWERDPDPARPVTSVTQLAAALKDARARNCDFRTLQNKIRTNKLDGGKYLGKARWWVYTDTAAYRNLMAAVSDEPTTAAADVDSPSTEAALRGQIADLIAMAVAREKDWAARENHWHARDRDHQDKIRQLMAASAGEAERADSAHKVNESLLTAHEHLLKALTESRSEAVTSLQISNIYRDLLASHYIPDDPGELTQR